MHPLVLIGFYSHVNSLCTDDEEGNRYCTFKAIFDRYVKISDKGKFSHEKDEFYFRWLKKLHYRDRDELLLNDFGIQNRERVLKPFTFQIKFHGFKD